LQSSAPRAADRGVKEPASARKDTPASQRKRKEATATGSHGGDVLATAGTAKLTKSSLPRSNDAASGALAPRALNELEVRPLKMRAP
jgi:hypothetical protein